MKKDTLITIASVTGTLLTIGASLLNSFVSDQKLDEKVDKKIAEALAQLNNSKPKA